MMSKNLKSNEQLVRNVAAEKQEDSAKAQSTYRAPELHDVGKAADLVQGGGGGNYLDANRSRYY
jgi:hypothetical protein